MHKKGNSQKMETRFRKYDGKTLLVLGNNVGAVDIVQHARENGAFVLVADYYPPDKSPAKKLANMHCLISTADLNGLGKLVEEYHVDGILSGISEFNILQAMTLSERYSLPFYCTRTQWEEIERKDRFRALCTKYRVPSPETYYVGGRMTGRDWEKIKFPAVIKPVDACASTGVYICSNIEEMHAKEQEVLSCSSCGKIIVEEYVKGNEFTAHYTIVNGKAKLACVDNRYPVAVHKGQVTTVPVARIYPSTYLKQYVEEVDPFMIALCESIGLSTGILFIQGLYDEENECFHIFEAGLRSAAEAPYRMISKVSGINAMHLLVDHALSVPTDYQIEKEDPYMGGKCCGVVSFVAKSGIVGSITGLEEAVAVTPSVIEYENRYPAGSRTPDGNTLRQLMIRFVMICDDRKKMADDITYLNEHIHVRNIKGEEMVIKMDPLRLFSGGIT